MRGGKRLNRDALSLRGLYEWVQVLVCAVTATVLLFTFAARVVLVSGPPCGRRSSIRTACW